MTIQFSKNISIIISFSKEEANRMQNQYIEPEHILLGIIRYNEGKAIDILNNFNINLSELKTHIEERLRTKSDFTQTADIDIPFSDVASRILKMCILETKYTSDSIADTEHVLLAILKEGNNFAAILLLSEYGVTYEKVIEYISQIHSINSNMEISEEDQDKEEDSFGQYSNNNRQEIITTISPNQKTPFLDKFGIDFTQKASEGKFDPVIGRENQILRLEQILCRRKKNNPILIGEPGVGKSAIVEGLALQIVQNKVSPILYNKRIVQLDMASVVAGTKYRGQFEERIQGIIKELNNNKDIILFIDEIHTIIGAGSTPGSMDAANMLKPSLARGDMQCVGATTIDEYRKNIEKDGALDRRFQKVMINATTADETLQILKNIKEKYEDHHNVIYTEDALEACVRLSDRYISDRKFPDKAIDVLDEVGSKIQISTITIPKEIESQKNLITYNQQKKYDAVKSQNFELAAFYRDKEKKQQEQLLKMQNEWREKLKNERKTVTSDDVSDVVSMISGVPVQGVAQSESVKLINLQYQLQSVIIEQDIAIKKIVKAIMRNRVGLKDPNRPIGTFMFLGPTGVGKTYLAKELTKFMFGSEDALIRIDMSEYMDKFTVSQLIGAPPGYVGYDEGGQLTEKVKRRPYSIILFDEIEKAHSDIYNILLQIMDDGRLTDSYGTTVDFKNTIIILTSNVGTRQMKEFGRGIGFSTATSMTDREISKNYIKKALNKTFAPEFINRLDEIITFDPLSLKAVLKILDLELKTLFTRIENLHYNVDIDDDAKHFVALKGYDAQLGARPLRRAIQNYIEDSISELIVSGKLVEKGTVHITYKDNDDKLTFSVLSSKKRKKSNISNTENN